MTRIRDHRGNVAVSFALAVMALAALGGGALTMARLNGAQTRLQDLADGSALAAVITARDPYATDEQIESAARRFGREATAKASTEFEAAVLTLTIVKRSPAEVTVRLDQKVHTILAAFVGRDHIALGKQATAVSGPEQRTCLHVLDPTAAPSLKLQGSPDLAAPDCVVQVNSASDGAVHAQGAPKVAVQAAYVAGPAAPLRRWAPAPLFGQPPRPDPMAGRLTWPTPRTDCIQQGADAPRPVHYCDGLLIGRGVRLEPGLYVVQSGGIRVEGRGAEGRGVTLILLDPEGEFDIRGGSDLSLAAPTSGPWAGIAIAAKPGAAMPTSKIMGDLELEGAVYMPGQRLLLQGSPRVGGAAATRSLIVRQLTAQGSPELSLAGGHPSGAYGGARLSR